MDARRRSAVNGFALRDFAFCANSGVPWSRLFLVESLDLCFGVFEGRNPDLIAVVVRSRDDHRLLAFHEFAVVVAAHAAISSKDHKFMLVRQREHLRVLYALLSDEVAVGGLTWKMISELLHCEACLSQSPGNVVIAEAIVQQDDTILVLVLLKALGGQDA